MSIWQGPSLAGATLVSKIKVKLFWIPSKNSRNLWKKWGRLPEVEACASQSFSWSSVSHFLIFLLPLSFPFWMFCLFSESHCLLDTPRSLFPQVLTYGIKLSDFIKILKIWDKERENCTVVRGSLKARVWHKVEFSALEGFTRRFSQGEFSPCAVLTLTQSCPTLCNLRDCSPPGNSVHRISQASILEWVATSCSRGIFLTQGSNLCLYSVP